VTAKILKISKRGQIKIKIGTLESFFEENDDRELIAN